MPTDFRDIDLFLFAHQDDEIGVFAEIDASVRLGRRPVCVYLTDGAAAGVEPSVRDAESAAVLGELGVSADDLHFLGSRGGIPDGRLVDHLEQVSERVLEIVRGLPPVTGITTHAWEGGHQDHDAAHLVGLVIARNLVLVRATRQFSLYRRDPSSMLPFVVFKPLSVNGPLSTRRIPLDRRLSFLRLLLRYPSQKRAILGLGPLIALHYFLKGTQLLQPIDLSRVVERPHNGVLLYEKRSKLSFDEFFRRAQPFLAKHGVFAAQPEASEATR